jgi:hypothetical protein
MVDAPFCNPLLEIPSGVRRSYSQSLSKSRIKGRKNLHVTGWRILHAQWRVLHIALAPMHLD